MNEQMVKRLINLIRRPDSNLSGDHAKILNKGRALAVEFGNRARHIEAWHRSLEKGDKFVIWPKERSA